MNVSSKSGSKSDFRFCEFWSHFLQFHERKIELCDPVTDYTALIYAKNEENCIKYCIFFKISDSKARHK